MREPHTTAGTAGYPVECAKEWARSRGLSQETLAKLSVGCGTAIFFPDLQRKTIALTFRYADGWKARSIEEKSFVAGGGFKASFWNLQNVVQSDLDEVFITEGELDACALVEAGVPAGSVLSVPNGAKEKTAENPKELRGYAYVTEAMEAGLSRARRIVWCGDADGPGLALRADMARLFGAARFEFVDWPEGIKDAGEMLVKDGPGALYDLVCNGALQWPVAGLYRMNEIPEPAPLQIWRPGFDEWESKVFLAPRTLSVVTGHPGHGKTVLWQQIWYQVLKAYELVACMASFETRAKPHIRRQIRSLHSGKLEKLMSDEERVAADAWINEHYHFLVHAEQRPTVEWFLDLAEVAVIRHGARIVQVDPWNRFEHEREGKETETEYIGRALKALHSFAHDLNCHVQILAHPAKMEGKRRGDPPSLEDISGSKNWHNMTDQGFVVHRPKMFEGGVRKTEAVLYHSKARFDELGYACQLGLNYLLDKGRYVSTDYDTNSYKSA